MAEEDRGDARDRGAGEEPAAVAPATAESRGRAALASGQTADVVGGTGSTGIQTTRIQKKGQYAYVPAGGRWPGGYYYYAPGIEKLAPSTAVFKK